MQSKKYREAGRIPWWKDPIAEGEAIDSNVFVPKETVSIEEKSANLKSKSLERYRAMRASKGTSEITSKSRSSSKDPWIAAFSQAISKKRRKKTKRALKSKDRFRNAIAMRNAEAAAAEMCLNHLEAWQKKIVLETLDMSDPKTKKVADEMVKQMRRFVPIHEHPGRH